MGFLFNSDFMEQLGYFKGEESEATHYSTFGGSDWKIMANKDQLFYWDTLSKSWRRWSLTLAHCTPIGEQEPNFRCGPVNQVAVEAVVKATELAPIYTDSRYKGD